MRQTLLTIVVLIVVSPVADAQRSQTEIATDVVSRMDRNGDGRLEAAEIPLRSRAAVGKLAREAGLDLAKPLSVDKLKRHLAKRKEREDKQQRQAQESPQPVANTNRIAGFGGDSGSSSAAGFGSTDNRDDARSSATSSNDAKSDKASSGGKRPQDKEKDQVRRYAEGLLKRFDANENGVLDKDEWSKMKGNPGESDTNKDGRLSVDELTVRLTNYGKTGKTSPKSDSFKSQSKKSGKSYARKNNSRKSYRFLTPTERLAESLPTSLRDWFLRNDKNGDGQIAMSEFASIWSRAKAVDFASYDQNNDGVITPQEYIRVRTGVAANN